MTIFSKIIKGDIPCNKIAEDNRFFAFLDINPVQKGHTLIVPKIEEDYIFNLEDDILGDMFVFAKKVAVAMKKAIPCARIAVVVMGMEVPHAHIHLIPINKESDLDFRAPKLKFNSEEMKGIAEKISAFIDVLQVK
ncbi:HIT family protein [Paludibacter sp.]